MHASESLEDFGIRPRWQRPPLGDNLFIILHSWGSMFLLTGLTVLHSRVWIQVTEKWSSLQKFPPLAIADFCFEFWRCFFFCSHYINQVCPIERNGTWISCTFAIRWHNNSFLSGDFSHAAYGLNRWNFQLIPNPSKTFRIVTAKI
jgi:hypothetical protein